MLLKALAERYERKPAHGSDDPGDRLTEAAEVGELFCGRRLGIERVELERLGAFRADWFGYVALKEVLVFQAKRVGPFRMLHADPPFVVLQARIHEWAAIGEQPFCTSRRLALVVLSQEFVTLGVSICLERALHLSREKRSESPSAHAWRMRAEAAAAQSRKSSLTLRLGAALVAGMLPRAGLRGYDGEPAPTRSIPRSESALASA